MSAVVASVPTTAAMAKQDVVDSVVAFARTGQVPESDDVATSELSSGELHELLAAVAEAEEAVKEEIRSFSSSSAPDINDWITRAAELQTAIAQSRETARSIVEEAAAGRALTAHVEDASAKVALLSREIDLSETLEGALDTIQIIVGLIDAAASAVTDEEVSSALEKLLQAEKVLEGLGKDGKGIGDCRAISLLEKRLNAVRARVVDEILEFWRSLVVADASRDTITVLQGADEVSLSLPELVDAMATLGLLNTAITRLHRDLEAIIISPRMSRMQATSRRTINSSPSTINLTSGKQPSTAVDTIQDIYKIVNFISEALPFAISQQLLDSIIPTILLRLVSDWLSPSLPLNLKAATDFKEVVQEVEDLAAFIVKLNVELPSEANLSDWLKKIPTTWLARRKESSLSEMRAVLYRAVKQKKDVERLETQTVQVGDIMYEGDAPAQNGQENDKWDEDWGNDETTKPDDDDTSAWDDPDTEIAPDNQDDDDDADAWGWGDEANATSSPKKPESTPNKRGAAAKHNSKPSTKEITLRETYTITQVPDSILGLINSILSDASALSSEDFPLSVIKPAAKAMGTIPTLLLAMYRATAGTLYNSDPAGQMLIYNDAVHLSRQLQDLLSELPSDHPLADRLRTLETDIKSLAQFSRRAYGREMDSQRTILSDILSSTSGFVNSTAPLNTKQYTETVEDAVKRVRDVNKTWRGILSDSARLQSLGSLTGTLVRQMILDILERADDPVGISEEQSKILKSFCDTIAELADLFQEPGAIDDDKEEAKSLVYIYTPGWFRFKYLSEILEASLADIRYMWTEGELKLEFRVDEVIDLIQALFADSSYRRDAIRDIKRST